MLWFIRIAKRPAGGMPGGPFVMLVLGTGFEYSVPRRRLCLLGAADDRLESAGHHSKIQTARTMAGSFVFGCGDQL